VRRPIVRRTDPRLEIIREAIERLILSAAPAHLTVTVTEMLPGTVGPDGEPHKHTWTGRPDAVAEKVFTALYGRPRTEGERSPLAQAEAAKRARDLGGEIGALTSAHDRLTSAAWYPVRPGDLVHVHYEATPTMAAFGETYIVGDAREPGDTAPGLLGMVLLAHTLPEATPEDDVKGMTGVFEAEAHDDPIYDLWFEAGPQRLTIVRDGQVVHGGPARETAAVGTRLAAMTMAAAIREAEQYLERGEPELALARLRSDVSLAPCAAPGFTAEQADCARPVGHRGACSENADYIEPPHECPKLPEQLHAVVTVGAKVEDVHLAGLYEDQEAAADHAMGFHTLRTELDSLTERFVKPAPGLPGEMVLTLPKENQIQATGVQLAVVVPLPVLPDPREDDDPDGYDYGDPGDDYDYDGDK
jgi:hypothetical protein